MKFSATPLFDCIYIDPGGSVERGDLERAAQGKLKTRTGFCFRAALALFALAGSWQQPARSYSVQTHEQLIDLAWTGSIQPLLRQRYPGLSADQLDRAHAFAYGGCAIQDLGYYPGGNQFFSDLTHYVRSGDFVRALVRDARTPDELGFAIGALSHYVGDTIGHSEATNPSVAEEFPSLEHRYGPSVPYDDSPHAHVRVEFAFDINEISKHRFAPSAYLRHVGLHIARDLLDRAFFETYGLNADQVLGKRRPTIRGYRFAVRTLLPRVAYAENLLHRKNFPPDERTPDFVQLEKDLARTEFESGWDQYRRHAGLGTYTLAGLIAITPKVGPLSMLAIRGPEPLAEARYVASLTHSVTSLRAALAQPWPDRLSADVVPNRDLDTGRVVVPGSYRLTDQTYARLLEQITRNPAQRLPAGLKRDVTAYYADPAAPISTRSNRKAWQRVQQELGVLAGMASLPEPV